MSESDLEMFIGTLYDADGNEMASDLVIGAPSIETSESVSDVTYEVISEQINLANSLFAGLFCFLGLLAGILLAKIFFGRLR